MIPTTQQPKDVIEYVPFGAVDKIKLSLSIVKNIIAVPTKSGKTCGDRDALRFIGLCQAQRLNPLAGDAFLVGYDKREKDGSFTPTFSLIVAQVAFLKRAESSSDFEGMESGIILVDENNLVTEREGDFKLASETVVGGWAKVYRKGRKPTYRRLSIAAMKPPYDTPFWNDDKAPGQIVKCCESQALRDTFPTLLGGLEGQIEVHVGEARVIEMPQLNVGIKTESIGGASESAPSQPVENPSVNATQSATIQQQIADIVTSNGHNFDHFAKWAKVSGFIPDQLLEKLTCFDDIPKAEATRLLRAKAGLIDGLRRVTEGLTT